MEGKKILVIGACGQIGVELTLALRERFGPQNVVATWRSTPPPPEFNPDDPLVRLDITDAEALETVCRDHHIDVLINMAALLSADGESKPHLCWKVNMDGLKNCLDVAVKLQLTQVLVPSSIAVFGPTTPKVAPQETILGPTTMYGITKVAGELLSDYYVTRFGLDVRGLRYPGIISNSVLPSGGTTDYAVEIFYSGVKYGKYCCYLRPDTRIPMMYMTDCIKATIDLMEASFGNLDHHSNFNVGALSFNPEELAEAIRVHIPDFILEYDVDPVRQAIADSWPQEVEDTAAREEWGWDPAVDLAALAQDMISVLRRKLEDGELEYVNEKYEGEGGRE